MIYTGIGSRRTPEIVLSMFTDIGKEMANNNAFLRSGGANGADMAFQKGHTSIDGSRCSIFLPWKGFNNNWDNRISIPLDIIDNYYIKKATQIAQNVHPAWDKCSSGVQKLHTRNVFQILGDNLSRPSDLVICWTQNGEACGGTRTAIKIAQEYNIPIMNYGKWI